MPHFETFGGVISNKETYWFFHQEKTLFQRQELSTINWNLKSVSSVCKLGVVKCLKVLSRIHVERLRKTMETWIHDKLKFGKVSNRASSDYKLGMFLFGSEVAGSEWFQRNFLCAAVLCQAGTLIFTIVWPCIVTDSLWIKPTDVLKSSFIGITTLHVSGSLSARHQEFLAVHQLWYILCSCVDRLLPGVGCNCAPSYSW
jgi:hypothetical protein